MKNKDEELEIEFTPEDDNTPWIISDFEFWVWRGTVFAFWFMVFSYSMYCLFSR